MKNEVGFSDSCTMKRLIKSESLSLYLRRHKENENNCLVNALHSPQFGPGYWISECSCVCDASTRKKCSVSVLYLNWTNLIWKCWKTKSPGTDNILLKSKTFLNRKIYLMFKKQYYIGRWITGTKPYKEAENCIFSPWVLFLFDKYMGLDFTFYVSYYYADKDDSCWAKGWT